nr:AIM24 family protein [Schwartzia sp. (in: firmicutes)]
MDYKILYPEAFPIVQLEMEKGETLQAESDAMIAMSPTIDVEGKTSGGFMGGLMRTVLTGDSFFLQHLTANRGPGRVLIGHPLPGGIHP